MSETAQDSVVITHDVGLHARPSVSLTKLAKTFPNMIEIAATADGPWIDAKSIVKVMAMKAKQHSALHIRLPVFLRTDSCLWRGDVRLRDEAEGKPNRRSLRVVPPIAIDGMAEVRR